MADTITDVTNQINTDIRNKTANKSVTRANVSDSLQILANNLRPDWEETDTNALTYIQNKPAGGILTRLDRVVYSTWDTRSSFVYNVPSGKTALFCIPYANPKVNITLLNRTFTPDDFVQQTNTSNIVNNDASGCSTTINGNTIKIQPKSAVFYETIGQGGSEFIHSSQINYIVDVYGF